MGSCLYSFYNQIQRLVEAIHRDLIYELARDSHLYDTQRWRSTLYPTNNLTNDK